MTSVDIPQSSSSVDTFGIFHEFPNPFGNDYNGEPKRIYYNETGDAVLFGLSPIFNVFTQDPKYDSIETFPVMNSHSIASAEHKLLLFQRTLLKNGHLNNPHDEKVLKSYIEHKKKSKIHDLSSVGESSSHNESNTWADAAKTSAKSIAEELVKTAQAKVDSIQRELDALKGRYKVQEKQYNGTPDDVSNPENVKLRVLQIEIKQKNKELKDANTELRVTQRHQLKALEPNPSDNDDVLPDNEVSQKELLSSKIEDEKLRIKEESHSRELVQLVQSVLSIEERIKQLSIEEPIKQLSIEERIKQLGIQGEPNFRYSRQKKPTTAKPPDKKPHEIEEDSIVNDALALAKANIIEAKAKYADPNGNSMIQNYNAGLDILNLAKKALDATTDLSMVFNQKLEVDATLKEIENEIKLANEAKAVAEEEAAKTAAEAAAKVLADAEAAKALVDANAKAEAEATNHLADAEALAQANALAAAAKAEAEASTKAEADALAKAEAEASAKADADALAKAEAEAKAQAEAQKAALAAKAAATAAASKHAEEAALRNAAVIAEITKVSVRRRLKLQKKVSTAKATLRRTHLRLKTRQPSRKDRNSVAVTLKDVETELAKQDNLLLAATIPIEMDVVLLELEVLKAKTEGAKFISEKSRKSNKTKEHVKKAESLLARINELIQRARSRKVELENTLGSSDSPKTSSSSPSASSSGVPPTKVISSVSMNTDADKLALREKIIGIHKLLVAGTGEDQKDEYFRLFKEYAENYGSECKGSINASEEESNGTSEESSDPPELFYRKVAKFTDDS